MGGESPYKRPSSQISTIVHSFPPLTYSKEMPSLICKIDLNKLPHISQLSRGQELRQRSELSNTRPSSRQTSSLAAQPPRPPTPEEGEIIDTPTTQLSRLMSDTRIHVNMLLDNGDVRNRSKTEELNSKDTIMIDSNTTLDGAAVNNMAFKRRRTPNCNSASSTIYSNVSKVKDLEDSQKRKRKYMENDNLMSRPSSSQVLISLKIRRLFIY